MLKWLRKYNTWILVIGGALLMIAFLLPQTIQEFGRRPLTGPVLEFDGGTIRGEEYGVAGREFRALLQLTGQGPASPVNRIVQNTDHWVLLTHEAEQAGLFGGPSDGRDMLEQIIDEIVQQAVRFMGMQTQAAEQTIRTQINGRLPVVMAENRLTEDELYQAFAKFKGVLRMRSMYLRAPRFSDRRMILNAQNLVDAAKADYVFVPAERETQALPQPDQAALQAHFDTYRAVAPGTGEFGIGYEQPARVKLEWLALNREAIKAAVTPDPVEVEKRLLRKFPTGEPPAGTDKAVERASIEGQVVEEQTDRVLKTADQTVRAEVDKVVRRLESDGDFRVIPEGWTRPNFDAIADIVVRRVADAHSVSIPKPQVSVESTSWLTANELNLLPQIGTASLQRGSRSEPFASVALQVREIASNSPWSLQVGIPHAEPASDARGNRFYFTIIDARKVSPPDSMDEVADQVRADIRRIAGFELLRAKVDELRTRAGQSPTGLEDIAASPQGAEGVASLPLSVKSATVDERRFIPEDPQADAEPVRSALLAIARGLDPTADPESVELAKRVAAVPVPSSLGVVVARVKNLSPITVESLREMQMQLVSRMQQRDLALDAGNDPYTLKAMEKRLNVKYIDRREESEGETEGQPAT